MWKVNWMLSFVLLGAFVCSCTENRELHHDHLRHADNDHHTHHGPIKDVDRYIARLERDDREAWQKPDAVVAALRLAGTETLADIGAGSGYFSFRFAEALSDGKVFAIEVEPKMVEYLRRRAAADEIKNVSPVLSDTDDSSVPNSSDWVFICNVLHHVEDQEAWLARLHNQLRPGAKVAIIEFKKGELPVGPPDSMKIAPEDVIEMVTSSGFSLTRRVDDLLPYQHYFVFSRD